jgi:hypothetical protein
MYECHRDVLQSPYDSEYSKQIFIPQNRLFRRALTHLFSILENATSIRRMEPGFRRR